MSQFPSKSALLWCVCRDFFPDWDESLNTAVSLLRTEARRARHDTDLTGHRIHHHARHPRSRHPAAPCRPGRHPEHFAQRQSRPSRPAEPVNSVL